MLETWHSPNATASDDLTKRMRTLAQERRGDQAADVPVIVAIDELAYYFQRPPGDSPLLDLIRAASAT